MLEKMGEFFDSRLSGYEEHALCFNRSMREGIWPSTETRINGDPLTGRRKI